MKYSHGLESSKKQIKVCRNGLVACAVLLAVLLFAGSVEQNLPQGLKGEITRSANFDSNYFSTKGKTTKGREIEQKGGWNAKRLNYYVEVKPCVGYSYSSVSCNF